MRPKLLGDTCEYEGCFRKPVAFDLCSGHYKQRRAGKELTKLRKRTSPYETHDLCDEENCIEPFYSNGKCDFHYHKNYQKEKKEKGNL